MAAASSTAFPRPASPSRRTTGLVLAVAAVFATTLIGVPAWIAFHAATRPKVIQVVDHAQGTSTLTATQAMHRTVDGIAFPDWAQWGWTPTGGRTDQLGDGRTSATTRYVRGGEAVTVSIISGTGSVDDDALWPTPTFVQRGPVRFELLESTASFDATSANAATLTGAVDVLKRHALGHTVILTGEPASGAMRAQLRALALRDLPSQQRETPGNR